MLHFSTYIYSEGELFIFFENTNSFIQFIEESSPLWSHSIMHLLKSISHLSIKFFSLLQSFNVRKRQNKFCKISQNCNLSALLNFASLIINRTQDFQNRMRDFHIGSENFLKRGVEIFLNRTLRRIPHFSLILHP